VRQAFAEMAEDDLQSRVFVEQPAADQAQCMHRGFRRESPGRSEQPGVTFVESRVYRRRARVQIKRNAEVLDRAPERTIFRQIVVQYAVRLASLRIAVDQ